MAAPPEAATATEAENSSSNTGTGGSSDNQEQSHVESVLLPHPTPSPPPQAASSTDVIGQGGGRGGIACEPDTDARGGSITSSQLGATPTSDREVAQHGDPDVAQAGGREAAPPGEPGADPVGGSGVALPEVARPGVARPGAAGAAPTGNGCGVAQPGGPSEAPTEGREGTPPPAGPSVAPGGSRGGGAVRPAALAVPGKKRAQHYEKYNAVCVKCYMKEGNSKKRAKLCDQAACGRWVHLDELSRFNRGVPAGESRCCVHNKAIKGICQCRTHQHPFRGKGKWTTLKKKRGGQGHAARGQGPGLPSQTLTQQTDDAKNHNDDAVLASEQGGESQSQAPTRQADDTKSNDGASEQGGGLSNQVPTRQQADANNNNTVFILPAGRRHKGTTILSVSSRSGDSVITSVDTENGRSSFSRSTCHTLHILAQAQHQMEDTAGATRSAKRKECEHAEVGFSFLNKNQAGRATSASFGGNEMDFGVARASVDDARLKGYLSEREKTEMFEILHGAETEGVYPVVKMGATGVYGVYDSRNAAIEHCWAHVEEFDPAAKEHEGSTGRSGEGDGARRLICKAIRGKACSQLVGGKRTRCPHVLFVALHQWAVEGGGSQGLSVWEEPEGDEIGEVGEGGGYP